jgi:hypothetical protein
VKSFRNSAADAVIKVVGVLAKARDLDFIMCAFKKNQM